MTWYRRTEGSDYLPMNNYGWQTQHFWVSQHKAQSQKQLFCLSAGSEHGGHAILHGARMH